MHASSFSQMSWASGVSCLLRLFSSVISLVKIVCVQTPRSEHTRTYGRAASGLDAVEDFHTTSYPSVFIQSTTTSRLVLAPWRPGERGPRQDNPVWYCRWVHHAAQHMHGSIDSRSMEWAGVLQKCPPFPCRVGPSPTREAGPVVLY